MRNSNSIKLGVERWCSWVPGEPVSLCVSYSKGDIEEVSLAKPGLTSIPPIQRRRLSPLARVVFHVLEKCSVSPADEIVIFSSRMGEIQRTQTILDTLASDEPVSPTAFSLSVHNAIAGLWSIVHGVRCPLLALAPSNGSPVPALLEAYGHLVEKYAKNVTIVCYEESLPDFYAPYLSSSFGINAIALRITQPGSANLTLKLSQEDPDGTGESVGFHELIEVLHQNETHGKFIDPGGCWSIEIEA
jgi:hypothetical protein